MSPVTLIQTASNAILFFIWLVFFNSMLEKRFDARITYAAWFAAFFIWFFGIDLFEYGSVSRLLAGPVITLILALIIYKSRWTRCLFAVAAAMVVMLVSEYLLLFLFPSLAELTVGVSELQDLKLASMYLVYLPLNATLLSLASLLFRRYKLRLTTKDWLLYALFPVSHVILMESWFQLLIGRTLFWVNR